MRREAIFMLSVLALLRGSYSAVPDLKSAAEDESHVQSTERVSVLPLGDAAAETESCYTSMLGIKVKPVPRLVEAHLPQLLAPEQGLLVTDVTPNSAASKAGLKSDDILTVLDEHQLFNEEQLDAILRKMETRANVALGVIRRGRLYKTTARLDPGTGQRKQSPEAPAKSSDGRSVPHATDRAVSPDSKPTAASSNDDTSRQVEDQTPVEHLPEIVRMKLENARTDNE